MKSSNRVTVPVMLRVVGARIFAALRFRGRSLAVGLILLLAPSLVRAAPVSADALVLVNSTSGRYLEFRNYIQPYLDHFGIPYTVQDITTNQIGTNLGNYALVIIGHAQFDTNHLYFSTTEQSNLTQAVAAGMGLVNFDFELVGSGGGTNYQYVQDLFGFSYPGGYTGAYNNEVNFFTSDPGGQLHYISARHPTNTLIALRLPINMLKVTAPAPVQVLARSGGQPFLAVTSFGQGRAVQWGSYDWVSMAVKGPIGGLDDLVWRSLIWAARKPFVMRGMPHLVSLRVDDTVGPAWWVGVANEVGMKPWLGPFIAAMPQSNIAELRFYATNGLCTVSPHSFTAGNFIYWDHTAGTNWADAEISNRMYFARQWHITNGIPLSKVIVPHTTEIGRNAFPWFQLWGAEYFTFVNEPGTSRFSTWLAAGPFRKHVPPRLVTDLLPLCYADFLVLPGYPQFTGQFFNATTIIKDDSVDGEWGPNNDVTATAARGVRQLKRSFDSLAQGVLWTHEAFIQTNGVGPVATPSITTNNWRAILQSITNQLAAYQPQYVTLDYACQYVRATRTAKLVAATFDPGSGQLSMTWTGRADLNLAVQVYVGAGNAITNLTATLPPFTNTLVIPVQIPAPPAAPPALAGAVQSNSFKLTFSTSPGWEHRVEYRQNINTGTWLPLTNFTAANTNASITEPLHQTQRFYRVRIPGN